ncbi:MAG: Antitoxin VapB40 [Pedosphaera sp.]|nr:Antitoxin VapB40 [Pedosphaera sp.]
MKDVFIPIDQAGRIVLPKHVRQELSIKPGDLLKVSVHDAGVTLTPNKEATGLVRKGKALVFSTTGDDTLGADSVNQLLQAEREEHAAGIAGGLSRTKPR